MMLMLSNLVLKLVSDGTLYCRLNVINQHERSALAAVVVSCHAQ
jgi:hypothetical protein